MLPRPIFANATPRRAVQVARNEWRYQATLSIAIISIVLFGTEKEVIGADTMANITMVQDAELIGDRPDMKLIAESMCIDDVVSAAPKLSIPVIFDEPEPHPARPELQRYGRPMLVHHCEKSIRRWSTRVITREIAATFRAEPPAALRQTVTLHLEAVLTKFAYTKHDRLGEVLAALGSPHVVCN
jgi:hypothetical protein